MTAPDETVIDLTTSAPALPAPSDELTERILDAALVLVARWGIGKTALADVAKEAGCSRATLYRAFPGGKQHVFATMGRRELASYHQAVVDAIDTADDLADAVTRALVVATRLLRDHDAAQFVLEHEPGHLLPYLGFKQVEVVYRMTSANIGPHLERYLPADRAQWLTEWVARLFISYLFQPDPDVDLAVAADARALVDRFVLPTFVLPPNLPPT